MPEPNAGDEESSGASAPTEVTLRTITAIFRYTAGGRFTHSGQYGSARFNVVLRPCHPSPADFEDLMQHASDSVRDVLAQTRRLYSSEHFMANASHFLITDATHPIGRCLSAPAILTQPKTITMR
jgi:hypothetical protein